MNHAEALTIIAKDFGWVVIAQIEIERDRLQASRQRLREALNAVGEHQTLGGEKYKNYESGWFGVAEYARDTLAEDDAAFGEKQKGDK